MTRDELFDRGSAHIAAWCAANGVTVPTIEPDAGEPEMFGTCAYYRNDVIYISVLACAGVYNSARSWSYPGYVVDRTPYGVLAHELGHHVDRAHGSVDGLRARRWYAASGEPPITTYAPNVNEWFAEIFRLFVTNPSLCALVRPRTCLLMTREWPVVVEKRPWKEVLAGSARHQQAAKNKIHETVKRERKGVGEERRLF